MYVCVYVCVGGGAKAWDKTRTSARLCAKNAGGSLCARGGVFAGHYGMYQSMASFTFNISVPYVEIGWNSSFSLYFCIMKVYANFVKFPAIQYVYMYTVTYAVKLCAYALPA